MRWQRGQQRQPIDAASTERVTQLHPIDEVPQCWQHPMKLAMEVVRRQARRRQLCSSGHNGCDNSSTCGSGCSSTCSGSCSGDGGDGSSSGATSGSDGGGDSSGGGGGRGGGSGGNNDLQPMDCDDNAHVDKGGLRIASVDEPCLSHGDCSMFATDIDGHMSGAGDDGGSCGRKHTAASYVRTRLPNVESSNAVPLWTAVAADGIGHAFGSGGGSSDACADEKLLPIDLLHMAATGGECLLPGRLMRCVCCWSKCH